jgi:hypothetical protein
MPLNFPNELAELNLLCVLSLLNFGHGYRVTLHRQTSRGAWDSVRALVFAMYISGEDMLTAKGMESIQAQFIAELMGIQTHVERAHESIPGLMVGELGGEGYQLVKMITEVLNETGKILVQTGYRDLGTFVAEALKEGEKAAKTRGEQTADVEVVLDRVSLSPVLETTMVIHVRHSLFAPSLLSGIWLSFMANVSSNAPHFHDAIDKHSLSRLLLQKGALLDPRHRLAIHVGAVPHTKNDSPSRIHGQCDPVGGRTVR